MTRTRETGSLEELLDFADGSQFNDGELIDYLLACLSIDPLPTAGEYAIAGHVGRENLRRQVVWSVDSLGRIDHDSSPSWV